MWHRRRDLNPGHMGGRQVLSPLRHPLLPDDDDDDEEEEEEEEDHSNKRDNGDFLDLK